MVSILLQLPKSDRPRAVLAGTLIVVAIAYVLGTYLLRIRPVNRGRREQRLEPLRWREITALRATTKDLSGDDAGHVAEEARRLRRQMDWEAQQAAQEMMRYGRSRTRGHCSEHDRFCVKGWEGPHPSGGHDNPIVPDDWEPPGSNPVRGA